MAKALCNEIEKFLLTIEKPARYIGNECNIYVKEDVSFRMAISYPDLYEVGMSNNGIKILYSIVNSLEGCACERVFAVAPDFAQALRAHALPLHTLETCTPLADLDLIGINVSHEMLYTNVLQILDLGKIPLLRSERNDNHPIVLAGGEAVSNPAPLIDFIDCFFIGEGEEGIVNIVTAMKNAKEQHCSRKDILRTLAEIEGVFVPSMHEQKEDDVTGMRYFTGATVRKQICPVEKIQDPLLPVVPNLRVAQERAVVEVSRGCRNLCKFCHAGYYTLPCRYFNVDQLTEKIQQIIQNTGYDSLALSSLSLSDYKWLILLLNKVLPWLNRKGVSISLPSLKVDTATIPIIEAISEVRKTSLTFAVETASDEIRKIIHKRLSIEDLLYIVSNVFSKGWRRIKLYFMIGLPGYEEHDEADAIIGLLKRINQIGKGKKSLNVTISPFVPKPHTPLQWHAMADKEYFLETVVRIKRALPRNIAIKNHNLDASVLEGVLSRGDSRLGAVIRAVYEAGVCLDSWNEYARPDVWYQKLDEHLPEWKTYLAGRDDSARTPWDIIDSGIQAIIDHKKEEVLSDEELQRKRSNLIGELRKEDLLNTEEELQKKYAVVQRVRLVFTKEGKTRFLSHLDMIEIIKRFLRVHELPVAFSQGFNKRERISAGYPLPLGVESAAEIIDVDMYEERENVEGLLQSIKALPDGIRMIRARFITDKRSLMSIITHMSFQVSVLDEGLIACLRENLETKIHFIKESKKGSREVLFHEAIHTYTLEGNLLSLIITVGKPYSIRIDHILARLAGVSLEHMGSFIIKKTAQYAMDDKSCELIEL